MPQLLHHIALKPLHTFGIDVYADSYFPFCENEELQAFISSGQIQPFRLMYTLFLFPYAEKCRQSEEKHAYKKMKQRFTALQYVI